MMDGAGDQRTGAGSLLHCLLGGGLGLNSLSWRGPWGLTTAFTVGTPCTMSHKVPFRTICWRNSLQVSVSRIPEYFLNKISKG